MVTNAYINTTTYTQEQDLIGSLVVEAIQMHGQDFTYIPRTLVKEDTVFNEDTVSSFTSAYTIEMYIDSADGFEGSRRNFYARTKGWRLNLSTSCGSGL